MKVLNNAAQDDAVVVVVDAKARSTVVQDILADSDNSSRRNAESECTPAGISSVMPGLLLSGASACRPADLRCCRVSCVVSAANELPDTPLPHTDTMYFRVPVMDSLDEDLTPYFDMVADIIEQVKMSGGCTLVHCVAGVSRSAALCIAYLMRDQRLSLRDAFLYLRSKRPQVRPNTAFFKQLIKYEERLFGTASVSIVYNEAAGKDIPDVYEPDYREMLWYRQRHCATGRY